MRLLAALTFAAALSCATSAAPNSLVRNMRFLDIDVSLSPYLGCRVEGGDMSVMLICAATSDGPFTYIFFHDGTEVQSSASTTYTINSPQLSDAGVYTCKVANSDGDVTSSDSYTLHISPPPSLTPNGPALVKVGVSSLSLTCSTTSEGSITYTFLQDGREVQRSESNMYNVSSLDVTDSGTYTCVASRGDEILHSPDSYVLTVLDVSVTSRGGCRVDGEDIPVTFTCAATSDGPFNYTFFQDGTEVQSSESNTYTIKSPQSSDAGTYTCKVANSAGEVNSSNKAVRPAVPGMDQRFQPLCYQNTLYYIHEDSFSNLNTSLSKCRQGGPGGMMAEYNDRDEINAIKAYLIGLQGFELVYIGAYYDVSTRMWRLLSTGEVLPITDWVPGEPRLGANSQYPCVALISGYGWEMYAYLCSISPPDDSRRFMCEVDLDF